MFGLDPATRRGWRIWGKAVDIATSGELYDTFAKAFAEKGKVNHVVKVLVEEGSVL